MTHQVSRGFSHLEAYTCPRHRTVSVGADKQGKSEFVPGPGRQESKQELWECGRMSLDSGISDQA